MRTQFSFLEHKISNIACKYLNQWNITNFLGREMSGCITVATSSSTKVTANREKNMILPTPPADTAKARTCIICWKRKGKQLSTKKENWYSQKILKLKKADIDYLNFVANYNDWHYAAESNKMVEFFETDAGSGICKNCQKILEPKAKLRNVFNLQTSSDPEEERVHKRLRLDVVVAPNSDDLTTIRIFEEKNRERCIEHVVSYIREYFEDDVVFRANSPQCLSELKKKILTPSNLNLSKLTLRESINEFSQVELNRVPILIRATAISSKDVIQFVHDLKVNMSTTVQAFDYTEVKIGDFFSSERKRKGKTTRKKSVVSGINIVEEKYSKIIDQHNQWNALVHNTSVSANSIVLSDVGAIAKAHVHPNMFWNWAINGSKVYILVDIKEMEQLNMKKKWEVKSTYEHTWPFNGRISYNDFMKLNRAYFCCTSDEYANFLLVPSEYMHEVKTVEGSYQVYGGLVGAAMPRSPIFLEQTKNICLQTPMQDVYDIANIDQWFETNEDELDKRIYFE